MESISTVWEDGSVQKRKKDVREKKANEANREQIYIYIYIYICVCVCMCVCSQKEEINDASNTSSFCLIGPPHEAR